MQLHCAADDRTVEKCHNGRNERNHQRMRRKRIRYAGMMTCFSSAKYLNDEFFFIKIIKFVAKMLITILKRLSCAYFFFQNTYFVFLRLSFTISFEIGTEEGVYCFEASSQSLMLSFRRRLSRFGKAFLPLITFFARVHNMITLL